MKTRPLRLTLAYDGTDFLGWQIQRQGRTVQGVVQAALARMHGHDVRVTAAGRTDSGVHAVGQVINFDSDLVSIPPQVFCSALNSYLPPDVRSVDSREVASCFDARKSARLRIYRYYYHHGQINYPHMSRYSVWLKTKPSLERLNRLASAIEGEKDFTVFAASGDVNPSKVRTVRSSCFYPDGPYLVYKIAAGSFLRRMVRSIVGTLMESACRGADRAEILSAIESRDRDRAGQTAPARGLFLDRVIYVDEEILPL